MRELLFVLCFVLGACAWSFAEYWIHYLAGHVARGRGTFSKEHLRHHANTRYFSPNWMKALSAVVTLSLLTPVGHFLLGAYGVAASAGFAVGYLVYEWLHRRAHTHAALTAYGERMRLHHYHHHFVSPMHNHGVTTRLWDRLFGTFIPVERVVVPRRMAMVWLLDAAGQVHAEHQARYALREPARAVPFADDHKAAFSNVAPA